MAGGNIGPKIGVQGEAEFKRQIADCNNSLKTMSTEMAKVTSAFVGNENSTKALKAANKALTAQFDELSNKADIQKKRLEELDKAGVDPTSASYQKLVQDLNKTETEMNKTAAQIDANNEKLKNHGQTAEEAHKKHAEAAKAAAAAVAGLTAAVVGVVGAIGKMTLDAAAAADELSTMATKTGLSTEELQKMQYAAESIDVDVETITGSMAKLTKQMSSAASGSKTAQAAFEKLGVSVTNDDGTFRDRNEVFNETIKALGEISDETERDAAAMAIFGKSAQELNPLILGGADALQQLGEHAEEAGLIMSEDDVNALAELNNRFDILKQTISMAGNQFLAQFAGPMTEGMNTIISAVERLVQAFKEGGFSELATTAGTIVTELLQKLNNALPSIVDFGTKLVLTLVEGIISMLPDIASSAITIITTLANSITSALPELIPVAVEAILSLVDTLTNPDSIGQMVDAAIAITLGLANGLIQALPQLLEQAPVIIQNLVTAIVQNAPKLLESAWELIKTLVSGIVEALPEIGNAAGQIIGTIVQGIADLATDLWNTGKSIVDGIWQGISDAWQWFKEKVNGFFSGIVDGVKSALGIASPSKVFAGIGENMALGLGVGWDKTMDQVERDMMSSIPVPGVNATVTGGYEGGAVGGSGYVEEITIPVTVGDVELARVLYRHIVGEGQRVGPAMVV
jgi:phage-related protein